MGSVTSRALKVFIIIFIISVIITTYGYPYTLSKTPQVLEGEKNFIIITKYAFIDDLKEIETLFPNYNYFYIPIEEIGNTPDEVRNFLFSHFNSGYVLLALSEKTLPGGRLTIVKDGDFSPKTVASDIFYAIEDMDIDKDGIPGEFFSDILKSGLNFRFVVSRLPFERKEDFKNYFNSVKAYLSLPPKVLLVGAFISFPNETYNGGKILTGDGARLMELLKGQFFKDAITLYEEGGDFPSTFNPTYPLTKGHFIEECKDATLIFWDAHGSSSGAYSEVWVDNNNNGVPEDGEFSFTPFISKSDTFTTHAVVLSGSCLNLNGEDNLGDAFLKNGAVSFIGSREISYTPSYFSRPDDGGSSSIIYYFAKGVKEGKNIGDALYESFLTFYKNCLFKDIEDPIESGILNIYDFNIYGVPTITPNGREREPTEKPIITNKALSYEFNYNEDSKEFTIRVKNGAPYFVILPEGLFVKEVYYEASENKPIFDWFFNIVRANNTSCTLLMRGIVRGVVEGQVIVKNNKFENDYPVKVSGVDVRDFNFDSVVDNKDFEILKSVFGKNYMEEGFLPQCDLDSNLRIDGGDVLKFNVNH